MNSGKHWTNKLSTFNPCSNGLAWARKFPTAQAAWDACENPEWMCWLLGKIGADRRDLTLLACEFARLALPYANGDEAELAIATAEQWAHGDEEVTLDDVRRAAADAAWFASFTTGAPQYSDYSACAASRADAAGAAAYASHTARASVMYADEENSSKSDTLRKCCRIIRRFYPEVPL